MPMQKQTSDNVGKDKKNTLSIDLQINLRYYLFTRVAFL